jgi:hypothetical protein
LRAFLPLSTLYIRGVFFLLGGKLLPLQGDRLASINNPGWCPGLGASALSGRTVYIGASVLSGHAVYIGASVLSGRTVYIGASVLSGRAVIRLRKFQLHEFCVKFIKKIHGNDGYCKYFVTFALDYENMN